MSVEFVAPKRVYQVPRSSATARTEAAGYTLSEPMGLAKTRTGGLATWFQGHPYPRKTFVYYGITEPNNKAKRITLSLFMPFASLGKGLKTFLNTYLYNYNRLIDSIYLDCDQIPYLHYQYYSEIGKGLWDFIYLFLKKLGIKDEIAYRTGLQFATMIEMDDAYLQRIQDILNESSQEAWLKNPRKELLRLVEIYKQRELAFEAEGDMRHAGARMIGMMRLLSFLLYVPWIKNAFKFAIENTDFSYFKKDIWDDYWSLARSDYNCGGRSFEERQATMTKIIEEYAQKFKQTAC